jgi:uncharacterized protein (DUF2147 family)
MYFRLNQIYKQMRHFPILILLISLFIGAHVKAQTPASDIIVGTWITENGQAHVKVTKSGNYYYGRIIWLKEPLNADKKPKVDHHNPDVSKQQTPIIGIKILSSFEYTGSAWEEGTIYDPNNGKTYKCKITLNNNNSLNIRGYVGTPMMGRTSVWTRVE